MTDKEKIKAIIQQYADKGERLLKEAYGNGDHASTTGFWEGFKNCAENLLRELEDIQEEPVSEDLDIAIGEYCSNPDNFITYIDVAFAYRSEQKDDIPLIIKAIEFGANWQLKKAINWFKSNINCDIWIKDFIKNMKE